MYSFLRGGTRRSRIVGTVAAVGILALTLSACAPGTSSGADGKTTLTILSPTIVAKPDGTVEQAIADAYMAQHPNVTIKFIGVPSNELQPKLVTMASSGTLPDIFSNTPDFAAKSVDLGAPADLNGLLSKGYIDGFNKQGIEQATVGKDLAFVPWYTIPTGLIYRVDLFKQAGLTPPTTWEEFVQVAQKLTGDTNGGGKTNQWGVALIGSSDLSGAGRFIPVMRSFGAVELEKTSAGWKTGYDTPGAAAAFQLYGDLVNKYKVTPPGTLSTSYHEAVNLMASGTTAMMISGSNAIGAILAQAPALKGKLAAVPIPHAPGQNPAATLGIGGYSVSSSSKNKTAAIDYLKFLLNKENLVKWSDATGRLPLRTDALAVVKASATELSGFVDAIQYGYNPPQAPFYPSVLLDGTKAYQSVILGQMTGTQAGQSAAAAAQLEIKNAG